MTNWQPKLDGTGPKYLVLAAALIADIESGRLPPGHQLPTQRELAYRLHLSVTTVTNAYSHVLKRGLIGGETGRGTFVLGDRLGAQFRGEVEGAIDLSLNRPAVHAAAAAVRATLSDIGSESPMAELMDYGATAGRQSHRDAAAAWLAPFGMAVHRDRIALCGGAQHAYTVAASVLLAPGDAAVTESLTNPMLVQMISRLLQLRLQGVAIDAHGIVPQSLDDVCRATAPRVLFCTPNLHDPTGATMPVERRKEIAAIAQHHDLTIVEDDRFGFLVDRRPPPLSTFAPERSVYINCTSKYFAPGLRLCFVVGPERLMERIHTGIRMTLWAAPPLSGEIVARWIADGTAATLVKAQRREVARRHAITAELLDGLEWQPADRSMHVWLRLPEPWNSVEFAEQAKSQGVVVVPDIVFTVGRSLVADSVRLSITAARSDRDLRRALTTIRTLIADRRPLSRWQG